MTGFSVILVVGGFFAAVLHYWDELFVRRAPADARPATIAPKFAPEFPIDRAFLRWAIRGLLIPIFVWLLVNLNAIPNFPPLLPELAMSKPSAKLGLGASIHLISTGFVAIALCWTMVSFGWMFLYIARKSGTPRELWFNLGFWFVVLSPFVWVSFRLFGMSGAPLALLICLIPTVHAALEAVERPVRIPSYSIAVARMKFGRFADAEKHVLAELEKCETDYDGWMMLAELYALHFHELHEAEAAIHNLAAEPTITDFQVTMAFHRLADWHLKPGNDPVAARRTLEEICIRMPGSHFATMARHRISQIPETREELFEQRKTKTLRMPALNEDFGDEGLAMPRKPGVSRAEVLAQIDKLAQRLTRNPNDVPGREDLALALAEGAGKVEMGIEQLNLLLEMPDQPEQKCAQWLAQIAVWQYKLSKDPGAARAVLERLIREFPQTPQAFSAQRRLNLSFQTPIEAPRPASPG